MTNATQGPKARTADMKLEIVAISVSDVDRAKAFYESLCWRLDADFASGDDWRVIQFTPPGSPCSVIFGRNVTAAAPGSAQGLYLIVSDIEAARNQLLGCGVKSARSSIPPVTCTPARMSPTWLDDAAPADRIPNAAPTTPTPRSAIPTATAGCSRRSPRDCLDAWKATPHSPRRAISQLRRAAAAHGEHEKRNGGQHDVNWPDWYAAYIVAEQAGKELPL
jgi:predicted enzyme related to lactoylglutathione lyase